MALVSISVTKTHALKGGKVFEVVTKLRYYENGYIWVQGTSKGLIRNAGYSLHVDAIAKSIK